MHGAAWAIVLAVVGKSCAIAAQFLLPWFIAPHEIGLAALALSLLCLTSFLSTATFQIVLVQRQREYSRAAPQVFWLALAAHVSIAIFLAVLAVPIAKGLGEPGVAPLVLIIALAHVIEAFPTIFEAALKIDLQFRVLAIINFFRGIIRSGLILLLAILGFGPYALVAPLVAVAIFGSVACRIMAGRCAIGIPRPRQWGKWLGGSSWLSLHAVFATATLFGPCLILSVFHGSAVTGLFFWGYNIAVQPVSLLVSNQRHIFISSLAKLIDEPERQYRAFHSLCRILTVVAVPACLLLAIIAGPIFKVLFDQTWLTSVSVIQWIAIASMTQPVALLATALLAAKGLYRRLVCLSAATAAATVLAAAMGAYFTDGTGAAVWIAVVMICTNLTAGYVAYRVFQRGWKELFQVVGAPLAFAAMAGSAGTYLSVFFVEPGTVAYGLVAAVATMLIYAGLMLLFLPSITRELLSRMKSACSTLRASSTPLYESSR